MHKPIRYRYNLDIADFLDENYPENALYPAEPQAKQADKDLIQKIGPVTTTFAKWVFNLETKTPEEWLKELLPQLEIFENELSKRGTTYFGGDKPGMVDYMLWPWGERAGVVAIKIGQKLPLEDGQLPLLRKWKKAMRTQSAVEETYNGPERFWKVAQCKLTGAEPDYDNA